MMGPQMDKNDAFQGAPALVPYYDDEIDLRELFGVLWAAKIPIVAFTLLCGLLSVWYAVSIPNQYKAVVVLAPAQQQSGGLSGALGQLGGLASLAGVSVGGGGVNESQIAQEIMQSWSFIERFINENDLTAEVYAVESWDSRSNRLQYNGALFDQAEQRWVIDDEDNGGFRPPSSWELYEEFLEKLSVVEDKKTDLVSVSIEYYSPRLAKAWVDMYVDAVNRYMQDRQIKRVASNIEFLQEQIEKTSIAEMKEIFYTIIQEQIKSKMLAEASPEYVFVAVSPSMVPEEKSQPKRALICVLATLLAGMLAVMAVLVVNFSQKNTAS
tara:strand:+ start:1080 stop:2054 length:975 start_codon:yes stop_codon:yes gene_type:complete